MRRKHRTTVEAAIFDENRDFCHASEARNDRPNTIRREHKTIVRTRCFRNGPAGNSCPMFFGEKSSRIFDFNATYALRDSGRYKMTYPSDDAAERRSWATVFDVGTFEGERWFGWYFCSDMLDITAKGYAAIYKEGSSASDAFVREARDKLKDAGLLRYGDFYRVKQFKCDDAF